VKIMRRILSPPIASSVFSDAIFPDNRLLALAVLRVALAVRPFPA